MALLLSKSLKLSDLCRVSQQKSVQYR